MADLIFLTAAVIFNIVTFRLYAARSVVIDRRKYLIVAGLALLFVVGFGWKNDDLFLFVILGSISVLGLSLLVNLLTSKLERGQLTRNDLLAPRSLLSAYLVPIFYVAFIALLVGLVFLKMVDFL